MMQKKNIFYTVAKYYIFFYGYSYLCSVVYPKIT